MFVMYIQQIRYRCDVIICQMTNYLLPHPYIQQKPSSPPYSDRRQRLTTFKLTLLTGYEIIFSVLVSFLPSVSVSD